MSIDRLIAKIRETDNPSVVGLDPRMEYIPDFILQEAFSQYGETLKGSAEAFYLYNKALIDEIYDIVPAVKPQIAMYEQYGTAGIEAYIKTIQYAKQKDLLVIGDIKRSDIASTAEAYADGHIGKVAVGGSGDKITVFNEDFITLNPYLGSDSVTPFLDNCKEYQKGLFILVKTSNPNAGEIQDLKVDGKPIYEIVGDMVSSWGEDLIGRCSYSEVGAVVGATYPEQLRTLRERMPHTFFLVPGYGAQGGKASDLCGAFDKNGIGAVVNSSRGIIAAYQREPYKSIYSSTEFAKAARHAAKDMREELQNAKG